MNEKEILEKYQKNCLIIGDAISKNFINDAKIRALTNENLELEKTMLTIKGSKLENTPSKQPEN